MKTITMTFEVTIKTTSSNGEPDTINESQMRKAIDSYMDTDCEKEIAVTTVDCYRDADE